MTDIAYCAGCGNGLIPTRSANGRTELSCCWCESVNVRTMDMAKSADSPSGQARAEDVQSFE